MALSSEANTAVIVVGSLIGVAALVGFVVKLGSSGKQLYPKQEYKSPEDISMSEVKEYKGGRKTRKSKSGSKKTKRR